MAARAERILSVLLGIVLILAPGAGALAVIWWVGATALVFGVLMILLGLRLKRLRETGRVVRRTA